MRPLWYNRIPFVLFPHGRQDAVRPTGPNLFREVGIAGVPAQRAFCLKQAIAVLLP